MDENESMSRMKALDASLRINPTVTHRSSNPLDLNSREVSPTASKVIEDAKKFLDFLMPKTEPV